MICTKTALAETLVLSTLSKNSSSNEQEDSIINASNQSECKRQAMMRQSRCNTNRDEVLKLSEQPAALYHTKYGGLPSQACPLLDIQIIY